MIGHSDDNHNHNHNHGDGGHRDAQRHAGPADRGGHGADNDHPTGVRGFLAGVFSPHSHDAPTRSTPR